MALQKLGWYCSPHKITYIEDYLNDEFLNRKYPERWKLLSVTEIWVRTLRMKPWQHNVLRPGSRLFQKGCEWQCWATAEALKYPRRVETGREGAEGLEELPSTPGRGGTDEADGLTAPICAAGKRFSWESPTALVSQCSNQEPAWLYPHLSLSWREVGILEKWFPSFWEQAVPGHWRNTRFGRNM